MALAVGMVDDEPVDELQDLAAELALVLLRALPAVHRRRQQRREAALPGEKQRRGARKLIIDGVARGVLDAEADVLREVPAGARNRAMQVVEVGGELGVGHRHGSAAVGAWNPGRPSLRMQISLEFSSSLNAADEKGLRIFRQSSHRPFTL